jgi:hypothetical protein
MRKLGDVQAGWGGRVIHRRTAMPAVIPAKAATQARCTVSDVWVPAFAGKTTAGTMTPTTMTGDDDRGL